MNRKPDHTTGAKTPASSREARLKAALKANLARRKKQARARAADETVHTNDNDKA
ncbi:hypothetical protein [Celeribacter sp.]|uniref:hypothetical protein n=1 Tax=Celeribacter sp. TaxID=1890673 RepID=UPI003A8CA297